MNNLPKIKDKYTDYTGRIFNVDNVSIGNSLGREVIGRITVDYSCTLKDWEEIWRDGVKPQDSNKMKIG